MKMKAMTVMALLGATAMQAVPAVAQAQDVAVVEVDVTAMLLEAARIQPLMQIVATEGARHGLGLEDSLFPGKGGSTWELIVGSIQAPERLGRKLAQVIQAELSQEEIAAATAYLSDGPGARIVKREVETRREMLDAHVEVAAKTATQTLRSENAERAALLDELIEALDLVTANVSGGLNANFAFYQGLADGGAMRKRLTEAEILTMVWNQEDEVRAASTAWLEGYLGRAYAPLSEADLREHIAFARSPVGQRYFSAMFQGFGAVFEETSYELGRAAANFIIAEDA
jgi:hypothetical protein